MLDLVHYSYNFSTGYSILPKPVFAFPYSPFLVGYIPRHRNLYINQKLLEDVKITVLYMTCISHIEKVIWSKTDSTALFSGNKGILFDQRAQNT